MVDPCFALRQWSQLWFAWQSCCVVFERFRGRIVIGAGIVSVACLLNGNHGSSDCESAPWFYTDGRLNFEPQLTYSPVVFHEESVVFHEESTFGKLGRYHLLVHPVSSFIAALRADI